MPSLIGEQVGGGTSGRYVGANFQKADAITNMGTRALTFLKITAITGATGSTSAVNFSTSYTTSDSNFAKAIRAIQQYAEVYAVGTPDGTGFIVVVGTDTKNGAEANSNAQATTYGALEAAIKYACTDSDTGASATVAEITFDGVAIS
jgi:hypothetical protein